MARRLIEIVVLKEIFNRQYGTKFRNTIRNKDMDLGDMNLSYIKTIVENETVSEVIYRNKRERGRDREREREQVPLNLRMPIHSKKQD